MLTEELATGYQANSNAAYKIACCYSISLHAFKQLCHTVTKSLDRILNIVGKHKQTTKTIERSQINKIINDFYISTLN